MKICYVINSLDGGGGALPLPNVIGVMREAGHEVAVVSLMERDGRARPALEAADIPYTVIGGPRRRFLSTAIRLARIVRRTRPGGHGSRRSRGRQVAGVQFRSLRMVARAPPSISHLAPFT